jgi:transcriptional regulator with XRE-family HTH domain
MKTSKYKPVGSKEVAENVLKLRQAQGLTQKALGDKLGLTPQRICNIERAIDPPSLRVLNNLARAFDVAVADLVSF